MQIQVDLFPIQKRVCYIMSLRGFAAGVLNLFFLIYSQGQGFLNALINLNVWFTLATGFLYFGFSFWNHTAVRVFQVVGLVLVASMAILDTYVSVYGLGFMILAVLLAYKYGFFTVHPKMKLILWALILIVVVLLSFYLGDTPDKSGLVLSVLVFMTYFFVFAYFIYSEEIRRVLFAEQEYEKSLQALGQERDALVGRMSQDQARLAALETRIEQERRLRDGEPIDLAAAGITPAEQRLIELLCRSQASNKEIAAAMFVSVGTVKQHMNHIMAKLAAGNRSQVIAKCRGNFPEERVEAP
jgi:DNA-binding CsgD family transcriptional regulator